MNWPKILAAVVYLDQIERDSLSLATDLSQLVSLHYEELSRSPEAVAVRECLKILGVHDAASF